MTNKEVKKYFENGYRFTFGTYYGDSLYDILEDIIEELEEVEEDDYLYIEELTVNDKTKEIYIFIGNDE